MKSTIQYSDVLQELEARSHGMDNPAVFRQALEKTGLTPNHTKIILVAGGNGKGSVSATLQHLLLQTGQRVGLFTLPYLVAPTECIRLGDVDISPAEFTQIFARVNALTFDLSLTASETLTLMAFWAFYSEGPNKMDWSVFEVENRAGRPSSTTVIPHALSVISKMESSHNDTQNVFAVVSKGGRTYFTEFSDDLMPLVTKCEEGLGSKFIPSAGFSVTVEDAPAGKGAPQFTLKTKWGDALLALPGRRGAQNTVLALSVFDGLGFSVPHYLDRLKSLRWPGRMERVRDPKCEAPIFISGDSNSVGIQSLLEMLPHFRREHLYILVGLQTDSPPSDILRPLFDLSNTTIALTEVPRNGLRLGDYGDWLDRAKFAHPDPAEAFAALRALAKKKDLVLVTGSLSLVGEIRKWLGQ